MTSDRRNLIEFKKKNGGSLNFGDEQFAQVCGKGTITIDEKIKIYDSIYVKGLKHNLLSVN